MVEFLKSPNSVDSQGRRLNDAELQSHALRLAQSIPSASRMRCSFGWLRHFKRRLGVQWAADKLGRHRWVVEMDQQHQQQSTTSTPALSSPCEPKIKQELGPEGRHGSAATSTEDDDEEYHSTYEFGSDGREATPATHSPRRRPNTNSCTASTLHSDSSILSVHPVQQSSGLSQSQSRPPQQQQNLQSTQTIMTSYPSLFGTLPPLHIPSGTTPMGTISPLATTLDPKLMSATFASPTAAPTSAFGMSVDGKMRKVPTKDEAYEMLQSLLMYYEQDHSYIGEQQTLLLPRWIHQQRQILQQTHETEVKMMWMRQQQQNTYQALYQPFQQLLFPFQSMDAPISTETQHPYHRYQSSFSSTTSSGSSMLSPSSSPISPMSPLTPHSPTMGPFSFGIGASSAGLSDPFVSTKSDPTFSSALAGLEQQILSDPSILFSSSLQR
ncbi:hypothetical protein EDD21DRAFT_233172 [Dissophora ornata]|nr:hypothetical protein EDD21DRAFT_233172 [Dissophora ornata]